MDVVWLKRDVRLHDHGPLSFISTYQNNQNPVCILYLYEPDQLVEPTVHGSHIALINEGLVDLDRQLTGTAETTISSSASKSYEFQCLTVVHGNAVPTLQYIHSHYNGIRRIVCHEETGHYASYQRDCRVRHWCRQHSVEIREFVQSGVTRRLQDRDQFSTKLDQFLKAPPHGPVDLVSLRPRIRQLGMSSLGSSSDCMDPPIILNTGEAGFVTAKTVITTESQQHKQQCCVLQSTKYPLLEELSEIPMEHRGDRVARQRGGELTGLKTLHSFLHDRSKLYSRGISSPLSSWTSCSRLSIFLSWGHLSLRHVYQATRQRQEQLLLKQQQQQQQQQPSSETGAWRKSLANFQSRLHWRSHFIQKLESDPLLEKRDLHPSYQGLRRQPGDWSEHYYQAWATGRTGFPFVDACMRCLLQTGWINFRMRAMLLSFATYNLWLDWKRIAPHLARVFCDYEPGIHYPQLQMQAGTTGINAMRVYNVIKQGQDQDPNGVFVKRYVPELRSIPKHYIHEPWKIPKGQQLMVGASNSSVTGDSNTNNSDRIGANSSGVYPKRIIDAEESARIAKAKVHAIRQQDSTREIAQNVYRKHGSRARRDSITPRKKVATVLPKDQPGIQSFFVKPTAPPQQQQQKKLPVSFKSNSSNQSLFPSRKRSSNQTIILPSTSLKAREKKARSIESAFLQGNRNVKQWTCHVCTFSNDKPLGLVCSMCGTNRLHETKAER